MKRIFSRNCPECGLEFTYKYASSYYRAKNTNRLCFECGNKKKITEEFRRKNSESHKGIKHSPEWNEKIRKTLLGHKISDETKKRISDSTLIRQSTAEYKTNHANGIQKFHEDSIRYDNHIKKLSEAMINFYNTDHGVELRIKLRKRLTDKLHLNSNVGLKPSFNSKACKIIEDYGIENGYNFQHAENGGEYYIKELGYWVDGYDEEQNVVIEFNEKRHLYGKNKIKTETRKLEIIRFLKCIWIEFNEQKNNTITINILEIDGKETSKKD
jgi:hypothetical protein